MEPTAAEMLAHAKGRSFLEAPAGYGKTETIADALTFCVDRQLILTHTHAGVDSLRTRLKAKGVPVNRYHLETIDAFCLRLGRGYPESSGAPQLDETVMQAIPYVEFHVAAARVVTISAIKSVLRSTYGGVIVDEYQDCSISQHDMIMALSQLLPVRILGDPLQSLLGFAANPVIEWSICVEGNFDRLPSLTVPQRWQSAGCDKAIGDWLVGARAALKSGHVPVYSSPIKVHKVDPSTSLFQILSDMRFPKDEKVVILHRFANEMHSTALRVGKLGYTCMEEIEAKDLRKACEALGDKEGPDLVVGLLEFVTQCSTNPKQPLTRIVDRVRSGQFEKIEKLMPHSVSEYLGEHGATMTLERSLVLLDRLTSLEGRRLYRRELYYSMRRAIQLKLNKSELTLVQAAHEIRQRVSHGGRGAEYRIVSRPILVKGLQYDHVVLINPQFYKAEELYVALSRATKSVTVIGPVLDKIGQSTARKGKSASVDHSPKKSPEKEVTTPSLFE